MSVVNPWTALMQPIRSRPGDPLRKPPDSPQGSALPVAAAAMVVTATGVFDRPDIRLLPIIVIDFRQ